MRIYLCISIKLNWNALLISLKVCLAWNGCPFVRAGQTFFSQFSQASLHHAVSCHAASHRVASRRVAPCQAAATPRHADVVPIYSLLAFTSPPILTAPFAAVEVYWSADGRAGKRTGFPSQLPSQSPTVFLTLPRASPSSHFPSPLTLHLVLLRSIFFSSETHFPRLPAAVYLCLFLSLSPHSFILYVAIVLTMETHSSSSRRSSPFTLTTTRVVGSHPRGATHRAERKYLCRCIVSRFLSSREIPACDQYSRCQRNCQSYIPSIWMFHADDPRQDLRVISHKSVSDKLWLMLKTLETVANYETNKPLVLF